LETLSELARLELAQNRPAAALALVDEILAELDASALHGAREPLQVYLTCYQVLQTNHDPRAEQVLNEAHHRLQTQAATVDRAELRQSFLTNVMVNRTIVALWGKWA
jgi:hypothetical protein